MHLLVLNADHPVEVALAHSFDATSGAVNQSTCPHFVRLEFQSCSFILPMSGAASPFPGRSEPLTQMDILHRETSNLPQKNSPKKKARLSAGLFRQSLLIIRREFQIQRGGSADRLPQQFHLESNPPGMMGRSCMYRRR